MSVSSGNVTVSDETTIIGVEAFGVQVGPSSVTAPSSAGAGENVSFSVSTPFSGSDIDHGIVLYNESTLTDGYVNVNVTAPVTANLSPSDVIIEHTIASVSGVRLHRERGFPFGTTLENRSVAGTQSVADIVSFLANESDIDGVQTQAIDSIELNASSTAVADRGCSTNLTVSTLDSWASGTYRWIHVGANESDVVATDTGTLSIEQTGTISGTVTDFSGTALANADGLRR
ncbi:MAG: hypothetical protein U5K37_05175 [Natrialbaceae archaeon]|nr:hypothetical protein [Natrialbaceae archaeon]